MQILCLTLYGFFRVTFLFSFFLTIALILASGACFTTSGLKWVMAMASPGQLELKL